MMEPAEEAALRAELDALRKRNDELEDLLIMATGFKISARITVDERGAGKWCIYDMGEVLNDEGEWEFEPMPGGRDEAFLARTRFDRATALRLAKEKANEKQRRGGCPV